MCMPHTKIKVLSSTNLIRLLNIESHHLDPCVLHIYAHTRTHAPQSNIDNIHFLYVAYCCGYLETISWSYHKLLYPNKDI